MFVFWAAVTRFFPYIIRIRFLLRLFSSDPTLTALKSRQKSELFDNGADFEVQIKLEIPMEAYPWVFNTNRGDITGGGASEGGRAGRRGRRRGGD